MYTYILKTESDYRAEELYLSLSKLFLFSQLVYSSITYRWNKQTQLRKALNVYVGIKED